MDNQLLKVIKKYRDGKASKEEIDFLHLYYAGFENEPGILDNKSESEKLTLKSEMEAQIMDRILSGNKNKNGKIVPLPSSSKGWYKVAAAASVILLVASFAFYFLKPIPEKQIAQKATKKNPLISDIAPGGNKAVLTLSDGSTIILDSAQNGTLSSQGNIKIIKLNDGQLAYNQSGADNKGEVLYNTISTPKGGQYQLILSDGSKVWLNAASSLRFPATFTGSERKVELTGEGYFEVSKNKTMPFRVVANKATVEVLGTHFNIDAYEDDQNTRTTLLEGSVKVSKGNSQVLIVPGEQASVEKGLDKIAIKKNVDVDNVVAWKKGFFSFQNAGIKMIMQEISRWYNVEVVYHGDVPDITFSGEIGRNLSLNQVLSSLKEMNIDYKIEGSKLIITP